MASNWVAYDNEVFFRLCEALGLAPEGILELTVHCDRKNATTYDVKYIHEGRKRTDVAKEPANELPSVYEEVVKSYRDDRLL